MSDITEPTYADRYFAHLDVILEAQGRRDRATALDHSRQCLSILAVALAQASENPVLQTRRFAVPPFELLCEMLPVFLADAELDRCLQIARACKPWCSVDYVRLVEDAIEECSGMKAAYVYIEKTPGCLQTEVKRLHPLSSNHLYWASHLGYLRREKAGRTFRLHLEEQPRGEVDYPRLRALSDAPLNPEEARQLYFDSLQRDVDSRVQRAEHEQLILASRQKKGRRHHAGSASSGCLLLWLAALLTFGLLLPFGL